MTSFTSRLKHGGWNVFDRPQSRDAQNLDDLLNSSSQHSIHTVASEFQQFFGANSNNAAAAGNSSSLANQSRRKNVNEMNIFGSNIVSREFILERMQQVEDNKGIVRLVFEDMIDEMDTELLVATMDVLTCDDRRWRRIKFLDSIDLLRFERWNEKRLVLLNHLTDEGGDYPLHFQANFEFSLERCSEDDINNASSNDPSSHEMTPRPRQPLSTFLDQDGTETVANHPAFPTIIKLIKVLREIRREKSIMKLKFGGELYLLEAENEALWDRLLKLVLPKNKVKVTEENGQERDSMESGNASTTTSSKVLMAVHVRLNSDVSPSEYDESLLWRGHMEKTLAALENIAGVESEDEEHNKLGDNTIRESGNRKNNRRRRSNHEKRRTPQRTKSGPLQRLTQSKKPNRLPKRQASESNAHLKRRVVDEEMSSCHPSEETTAAAQAGSQQHTQSCPDMVVSDEENSNNSGAENKSTPKTRKARKRNASISHASSSSIAHEPENLELSTSRHARFQTKDERKISSSIHEKSTLKKKKPLSPITLAAHDALTTLRSSQRTKKKKVRIVRTKSEHDRHRHEAAAGRRRLQRISSEGRRAPTTISYDSESDKGEIVSPHPLDEEGSDQSVTMSPEARQQAYAETTPETHEDKNEAALPTTTSSYPVVKEASNEINNVDRKHKQGEESTNAQTIKTSRSRSPKPKKVGPKRGGSSLHRMRAHVRKKKNADETDNVDKEQQPTLKEGHLSSKVVLPVVTEDQTVKTSNPSIRSHRSLPSDLEQKIRNEDIGWHSSLSPQQQQKRRAITSNNNLANNLPPRGKTAFARLSPHSVREQRSQDLMYAKMFTLDDDEQQANNTSRGEHDLIVTTTRDYVQSSSVPKAASFPDLQDCSFLQEMRPTCVPSGKSSIIGKDHLLDDLSKNDPESEHDAQDDEDDDDPLLHIDDMAMLQQQQYATMPLSSKSDHGGGGRLAASSRSLPRRHNSCPQKSISNRSSSHDLSMDSSIASSSSSSSDLDTAASSEGTSNNDNDDNNNDAATSVFAETEVISMETKAMWHALKHTWESERSLGVQFPKMMRSKDEVSIQTLTESIDKLADEVLDNQVASDKLRLSVEAAKCNQALLMQLKE